MLCKKSGLMGSLVKGAGGADIDGFLSPLPKLSAFSRNSWLGGKQICVLLSSSHGLKNWVGRGFEFNCLCSVPGQGGRTFIMTCLYQMLWNMVLAASGHGGCALVLLLTNPIFYLLEAPHVEGTLCECFPLSLAVFRWKGRESRAGRWIISARMSRRH